jgi:DNA-binding YbaB/EbfC family protein
MGMMDMMKQMKELRRMQKEIERKVVSAASADGRVQVEARGDMTLKSIKIDPAALEDGKVDKLQVQLLKTVNQALDGAKKAAAAEMQKMSGGLGGLNGMLGG